MYMGQCVDVATYLRLPDTPVSGPSQVNDKGGVNVRESGSSDVNSQNQERMDAERGDAPRQEEAGNDLNLTRTPPPPSVSPPATSTAPPPPSVPPPAARTAPLLSTAELAGRGPGGTKRKAETSATSLWACHDSVDR